MTTRETPKWPTVWLLAGFGLLIGIGVVTVLLPELSDEPEPDRSRDVSQTSQTAGPQD